MLRFARDDLDKTVEAVCVLAAKAMNNTGLRVMMSVDPKAVERHLLAMMAILSPGEGGPDTAMPADVNEFTLGEDGVAIGPHTAFDLLRQRMAERRKPSATKES